MAVKILDFINLLERKALYKYIYMLVKILNFLKVTNCYKYVYYGMMLFSVTIILCSGVF